MFVVTHGQRGSERFEWQSVHKVGEMWEQHKDAMEWPYWFMEGKIVRDPAGQLGQDRWWAGGTPRRTVFSHSIVRGTVRRAESHLIPEASAPNPAFPWWPARVAPCSAGPAVWIVCPGSRPSVALLQVHGAWVSEIRRRLTTPGGGDAVASSRRSVKAAMHK